MSKYIQYINDNGVLVPTSAVGIMNEDGTNEIKANDIKAISDKIGDLTTQGITESTLSEAIKNDRTQLTDITINKANQSDIIDNLISTDATKMLSAKQGKVLNDALSLKANQSTVDTISNNVNANTTAITNIGNGSPKGAYTTLTALQAAYPTGTTGIYVVTADGGWYYWNGSAWTKGGTYQSTALDSVTQGILSKSKIINTEVINGKNLFDLNNTTSGYDLNNSGNAVSSANYSVTDYITILPSTGYIGLNSNFNICFYDSNKIFISKQSYSSNSPIISPSNASYIKISLLTANIGVFQIEVGSSATSYEPYKYLFNRLYLNNKNQINNNIMYADDYEWTNFIKNGNLAQSGSPATNWAYIGNGTLVTRNGSIPAVWSINSATTWSSLNTSYTYSVASKRIAFSYSFTVSSTNFANCNFKVWFKGSGGQTYSQQTISNITNGFYKGVLILDIQSDAISTSALTLQFSEFQGVTSGQNAQASISIDYFMCFDISGSNHAYSYTKEEIQKAIDFRGGYSDGILLNFLNSRYSDEAVVSNYSKYVESTWKGKNFVTFGDSLTAMGYWQPYVISKLGFATHTNCGIGGTAVSVRDNNGVSYNTDSFFQDTRINAIPNNADLITIMGGFNDFNQFSVLGGSLPSLDSTTFKGALSLTIEKILTKTGMNPNVRIVLMTEPYGYSPSPNPDRGNISLKGIVDAIKEVGQFYGLPVIDLYGTCGWNYKNSSTYLQDSVHPNSTVGAMRLASIVVGQLRIYEPI